MSRVITVNKSIKDERLTDMFAQMTGAKAADPNIIIPKYNNIRKNTLIIIKTLEKFAQNPKLINLFTSFARNFEEIISFTKVLHLSMQYDKIAEDKVDESNIHTLYKTCKEDNSVKSISVMCARLRKDQHFINDLNVYFIGDQPDNSYTPLPFTGLNFTNLWTEIEEVENGADVIKKYILTVLKKLMEKSYEIHNTLISPDIDIEEFSHVFIEAISKARSMLPRCGLAFDKIEESVNILKSNFGDYYKSFMISKNPNSIFESFVIDVSSKQKGNTKLKWQFMQIVNFYRKHSAGKVSKDSNLKYIFDTLDDQLSQLDKATKDDQSEAKTDNEIDDEKSLGFHWIDLLNDENQQPYILVVEGDKYNNFLNYLSNKSGINEKELKEKIAGYLNSLPTDSALEVCGIYRTMNLNDFDNFEWKPYLFKVSSF